MTQQTRLIEFFAMEASEYLERLDALVSGKDRPRTAELVRLTRALRGSALMAKQESIAGTAAALENFARALDEGRRSWDEGIKQLAIRAVDDFKILVRKAASWGEAEDRRAERLADELDRAAGRSSAALRARVDETLDTGTRAFVGREGAAVASALDRAAEALGQRPGARDPLERVVTIMRPLRGLAMLSELPPVPDLLDGVERAIRELTSRREPVPDAGPVFAWAAKALARAAQEIATQGKADPDAPEALEFAGRLGRLLAADADVTPIQSLYFEDAGPHVVASPAGARGEGAGPGLSEVEVVAHGEHLHKAADELERARSRTERELRAQALAGTFRALVGAAGGALGDAIARFALAARHAVARGAAIADTAGFVAQLREAARVLTSGGGGSGIARLHHAALALTELEGVEEAEEAAEMGEAPEAAEVATPQYGPPASVAAAPTAPAAPAAADTPAGHADLAGSWRTYEDLLAGRGNGAASLEDLLAGAAAAPASPAGADGLVTITALVYSGDAALARAQELGAQVRAALRAGHLDPTVLNDLLDEVFDLVELGRTRT